MSEEKLGAILVYIAERCRDLEEEIQECRSSGVNTPGFNQTLGALDELKTIRDNLIHKLMGTDK